MLHMLRASLKGEIFDCTNPRTIVLDRDVRFMSLKDTLEENRHFTKVLHNLPSTN